MKQSMPDDGERKRKVEEEWRMKKTGFYREGATLARSTGTTTYYKCLPVTSGIYWSTRPSLTKYETYNQILKRANALANSREAHHKDV